MTQPAIASHVYMSAAPNNKPDYNVALGYLRAFVVMLVIAHHAALAYHPFAPPPPSSLTTPPYLWAAFPVVDAQRSNLLSLLVGFNDSFFMSLMFFLSGLFVWNSLKRKRPAAFLRDRLRRLGLPFLIGAGLLAPLAYYPAFLQTRAPGGLPAFWHQWLSLRSWPAGPAWFLWVLFVFDAVATALFLLTPKPYEFVGTLTANLSKRPAVFFAVLVALSAVAYVPMSLVFPLQWSAFGPFAFQTARIFHYLLYFLIAVALGALPNLGPMLGPGSKLRQRWPLWTVSALLAFVVESAAVIAAITSHIGSQPWAAFAGFTFSLSCAASCFAFLALFLRFANSRTRLLESLRDNSYGIYLLHYFCVSWLQYALLTSSLPALAKFSIVFLGALILSWSASASLRLIPAIRRVI